MGADIPCRSFMQTHVVYTSQFVNNDYVQSFYFQKEIRFRLYVCCLTILIYLLLFDDDFTIFVSHLIKNITLRCRNLSPNNTAGTITFTELQEGSELKGCRSIWIKSVIIPFCRILKGNSTKGPKSPLEISTKTTIAIKEIVRTPIHKVQAQKCKFSIKQSLKWILSFEIFSIIMYVWLGRRN